MSGCCLVYKVSIFKSIAANVNSDQLRCPEDGKRSYPLTPLLTEHCVSLHTDGVSLLTLCVCASAGSAVIGTHTHTHTSTHTQFPAHSEERSAS